MSVGTIFTALSYLTGLLVFYFSAKARKFPADKIFYLFMAGLIGGIFGAKLTRWLMEWGILASNPASLFNPQFGGRTIIGGIIFGWLAVELAKRYLGIKRSTGDSFALALPAGEAIGRIGCFLNGCCYGMPASLPWAVYQHDAWRHPAQIYSALVAALIFLALFALRNKLPREGDLFRLYLILYCSTRFALEFVRERTGIHWGLSMCQWICIEVVVTMLITFTILQYSAIAKTRGNPIG